MGFADIMKQVNMSNCGNAARFWQLVYIAQNGAAPETGKECKAQYDRYQGVSEFLPFAKGVSAKSYSFTEGGEEAIMDYTRLMKVVKESNFTRLWGHWFWRLGHFRTRRHSSYQSTTGKTGSNCKRLKCIWIALPNYTDIKNTVTIITSTPPVRRSCPGNDSLE